MKVAVYTTIFGDYAPLRLVPKQSVKADYFCITDNNDISNPGGWKIIEMKSPRKDLHSRLRAKYFKLFPWECSALDNYDLTIYIDGSIEIVSSDFVRYCLDNIKHEILVFKHPERDNIFDEALASMQLSKYAGEDISYQINDYKVDFGFNHGLFACGVLVRKTTPYILNLMNCWWHHIIKYTYQDQISFPVCCRICHVTPDVFPDNQYHNPYFKIHWNAK